MLDKLFNIFGMGLIHRISLIINIASSIMKTFESEFSKDNDERLVAIDTLIAILQKHRNELVIPTENNEVLTP